MGHQCPHCHSLLEDDGTPHRCEAALWRERAEKAEAELRSATGGAEEHCLLLGKEIKALRDDLETQAKQLAEADALAEMGGEFSEDAKAYFGSFRAMCDAINAARERHASRVRAQTETKP